MAKGFSGEQGPAKQSLMQAFNAVAISAAILTSPFALGSPALDFAMNEQIVSVPAISGGKSVHLETTIFKPPGVGPFPVVVMNHGKEAGNPREQERERFIFLSREFVRRGYTVVVPMRRGFSRSSGEYSDIGCNMTRNGHSQAEDIAEILKYVSRQSWADKDRIIVAGQSYGALATLALGARAYPGVRGLINFAGGLQDISCAWRQELRKAFAAYGSKTTLPSLWFYGENDSLFNHDLAMNLASAYRKAGGKANLVAYGPFKNDAHGLVASRDGVAIWWPATERFLKRIGMPTDVIFTLPQPDSIPATNYATLEDVDAIPHLSESGRKAYREFLRKLHPRAFAVSPSGVWVWTEEGEDPVGRAIRVCQKKSQEPCKLYAVDDKIVWTGHQQKNPESKYDPVPAMGGR